MGYTNINYLFSLKYFLIKQIHLFCFGLFRKNHNLHLRTRHTENQLRWNGKNFCVEPDLLEISIDHVRDLQRFVLFFSSKAISRNL